VLFSIIVINKTSVGFVIVNFAGVIVHNVKNDCLMDDTRELNFIMVHFFVALACLSSLSRSVKSWIIWKCWMRSSSIPCLWFGYVEA
jgi:hypothetical protein